MTRRNNFDIIQLAAFLGAAQSFSVWQDTIVIYVYVTCHYVSQVILCNPLKISET